VVADRSRIVEPLGRVKRPGLKYATSVGSSGIAHVPDPEPSVALRQHREGRVVRVVDLVVVDGRPDPRLDLGGAVRRVGPVDGHLQL
jgi:hypothetical protein